MRLILTAFFLVLHHIHTFLYYYAAHKINLLSSNVEADFGIKHLTGHANGNCNFFSSAVAI